jgi:ribosomal protein S25
MLSILIPGARGFVALHVLGHGEAFPPSVARRAMRALRARGRVAHFCKPLDTERNA